MIFVCVNPVMVLSCSKDSVDTHLDPFVPQNLSWASQISPCLGAQTAWCLPGAVTAHISAAQRFSFSFFFFSLAGFCRWEQLVFALWSAGGWPWWALANDYLIKICTKISLVPNTDFVRISFMFRSSFSAVIFKPFVTLWSVTPSPFSWSSAGSGHKLATV